MFYIAQLIGFNSIVGGTNSTEGFDIDRLPSCEVSLSVEIPNEISFTD